MELRDAKCNYEFDGLWKDDTEESDDVKYFKIAHIEPVERTTLNNTVEYIKRWVGRTKMEVLKNTAATNSYESHKGLWIFYIFMYRQFFEIVRQWTTGNTERKSQIAERSVITTENLHAYEGLEISASISNLNDLKNYESTEIHYCNVDFRKFLMRDHFLKIRALIQLYPLYRHQEDVVDPLLNSRAK